MKWDLRIAAARRDIWKASDMRRLLAEHRDGDQRRARCPPCGPGSRPPSALTTWRSSAPCSAAGRKSCCCASPRQSRPSPPQAQPPRRRRPAPGNVTPVRRSGPDRPAVTIREDLPPRLRAVPERRADAAAPAGSARPPLGDHRRCWQCSRTGDGTRPALQGLRRPAMVLRLVPWTATPGCARRRRRRARASPASPGECCAGGSALSCSAVQPASTRPATCDGLRPARPRSAGATAGCATARPGTWPAPRRGTPAPCTSAELGPSGHQLFFASMIAVSWNHGRRGAAGPPAAPVPPATLWHDRRRQAIRPSA